jgi:hypothetical protein
LIESQSNGDFKHYPNSFYDGGKFTNESEIQVDKMLAEGATFIDVEHIQVNLMLNLYLRTQK